MEIKTNAAVKKSPPQKTTGSKEPAIYNIILFSKNR